MVNVKYTTQEEIDALREEIRIAKTKHKYIAEKKAAVKPKNKSYRIFSTVKTVSFILLVAFLSMILVSVLIAKNSGKTPNVFGYQIYVVKTGSMIPTFPIGTAIVTKEPKDPGNLDVGTIVTFSDEGAVITHRIIEAIMENGEVLYRTKGDNPDNSPDLNLLTPDRIKGIFVMKIPFFKF